MQSVRRGGHLVTACDTRSADWFRRSAVTGTDEGTDTAMSCAASDSGGARRERRQTAAGSDAGGGKCEGLTRWRRSRPSVKRETERRSTEEPAGAVADAARLLAREREEKLRATPSPSPALVMMRTGGEGTSEQEMPELQWSTCTAQRISADGCSMQPTGVQRGVGEKVERSFAAVGAWTQMPATVRLRLGRYRTRLSTCPCHLRCTARRHTHNTHQQHQQRADDVGCCRLR